MKLTFEEAMREKLAAYHDQQSYRYHINDLVDADLKAIAEWLIKKWVKGTK